ncbi:Glycosyl transferase family group 2 domain containing protein [Hyaloscypha variabilis]
MCFLIFFFIVVVSCVFQVVFPLGNCLKNTKYHSAIKPKLSRHRDYELPQITIQMPVYKEGLRGVIVPTIISVMAAAEYYEHQGGTASVFINDDGMQAIEPELAEARMQYYRENSIGYVARFPQHKSRPVKKKSSWWSWKDDFVVENKHPEVDEDLSPSQALANKIGFKRNGKFKKASNMNYGLEFSERVEKEFSRLLQLAVVERGISEDELTIEEEDELSRHALDNMLAADEGRTWADGNIRIGKLILIIDCDTRVPVDCLLYGALEMHESPEVAILQHGSGVMQVVHNMFENGITYFTNIVYTSIKYGVGSGDVAPFVGHNAFIRWKALQSVAFVDESDGQTKWWSDSHITEDFGLSLRLQMSGMLVRLASYHNGGFKEGVSLTAYDELTRWEKYAYGCNELIFNPFSKWLFRGPFTALFRRFLWSSIPVTSKITIVAYIATYYAIGAGMLLGTVNYIVIGLFPDDVDHDYLQSWGIWVSLIVVFSGFSSFSFAILRHQMKDKKFGPSLLEAAKWLPFLMLFFGGISVNCAKALICHAFGINIEWASTAKKLGDTSFYINLGEMVQSFKYTWAICIFLSGVMVYFSIAAPWGWNITPGAHSTATIAIVPLAIQLVSSFLLPFGLGWLGGRVF